jgi:hypothetical protein
VPLGKGFEKASSGACTKLIKKIKGVGDKFFDLDNTIEKLKKSLHLQRPTVFLLFPN